MTEHGLTLRVGDGSDVLQLTIEGDADTLRLILQDVRGVVAAYRPSAPKVVPVMQSSEPCAGCPD